MNLHFMCNAFEEDPAIFTFKKELYCRLGLLQDLLLVLVVQVVPGKREKPDIRCFTGLYNAITAKITTGLKVMHLHVVLAGLEVPEAPGRNRDKM